MAGMQKNRTRFALLTAAVAVCAAAAAASTAAVAACSFTAVGTPGTNGRVLLQLTPAQDFQPSDGRPMDVPAWRINADIAQGVISRFNPAQPPVIDYEHQTLHKEKNGQPAPAAGWIHALRWVEGQGLVAEAELTAKAMQQIKDGEYRYFSPVFLYDPVDGDVLHITMGALTNHPAIHGMQALNTMQAAASAQFSATTQPNPEDSMTLLQQLLAKLDLPATTTEQVALTAVGDHVAFAAAARTALKLKTDDKPEAVTAACSAIGAATTPDPAKYVPIDAHTTMQTQLAALTARQLDSDIDNAIKPALADGRLNPAQEPWARELGKTNMAALSSYLSTAQPIAALSGTQTQGKPPAGQATGASLTADELAVCSSMGLTPEAYAATKAA